MHLSVFLSTPQINAEDSDRIDKFGRNRRLFRNDYASRNNHFPIIVATNARSHFLYSTLELC